MVGVRDGCFDCNIRCRTANHICAEMDLAKDKVMVRSGNHRFGYFLSRLSSLIPSPFPLGNSSVTVNNKVAPNIAASGLKPRCGFRFSVFERPVLFEEGEKP
ncbi:hypothetical protein RRG08_027868 [Elysia crispata]|uniref:Uncharacterized protein n=1 Tax=Elysia crispata TaxID=231223 RepID=A0AAE1A7C9_9GAST|nr:hypothetical protein RRG08_027868 [Elysia crispata]